MPNAILGAVNRDRRMMNPLGGFEAHTLDGHSASAGCGTAAVTAYCICTVVGQRALDGLLAASRDMGHAAQAGQGVYRDTHPWLVAAELLDDATASGLRMPVVFATDAPLAISHWAFVKSIDVRELHKGAWETRCAFDPLAPVNPIWETLDSLTLVPSQEQLHRERIERIRTHRQLLDATLIHPYAVCETPPFIDRENVLTP